jgi:bifunctional non-homologous end joining protein LigD
MFRVTSRLRFIEPQLASSVEKPPEGKHWIHEIKHDGYRSQVVIERGQVRVFSRNGHDWSDRYPLSSVPLPVSAANRQSLMVRLSSKMAMAVLILSRFNRP